MTLEIEIETTVAETKLIYKDFYNDNICEKLKTTEKYKCFSNDSVLKLFLGDEYKSQLGENCNLEGFCILQDKVYNINLFLPDDLYLVQFNFVFHEVDGNHHNTIVELFKQKGWQEIE